MKFTMTGRMQDCLLLTYRTPAESVHDLLPPELELVTRRGFAYWNIVLCRIENIRLAGMPSWLGFRYNHVAYRLHVKSNGVEGLYFVRSDANHRVIAATGDLVTDFRFHDADITMNGTTAEVTRTRGGVGDAFLRFEEGGSLPDDELLAYRPHALSSDGEHIRIVEVQRNEAEWQERPIRVLDARWGYFDYLMQNDVKLVRASRVDPIEYRWKLGRTLELEPGARGHLAVSG